MKIQCFILLFMAHSLLLAQNQYDTVQVYIGNKAKVLIINDDLSHFDTLKIDPRSPRLHNKEQLSSDSSFTKNHTNRDAYLDAYFDAYFDQAKKQTGGNLKRKKVTQITQPVEQPVAHSLESELFLSLLAGISFVQQSTVPFLQVGLEEFDPKRNFIKGLFLTGQALFFFNKDDNNQSNMDVNYFIAGGVIFNRFNRRNYLGLAYLIGRNGDYFAKNTWKISLSMELTRDLPIRVTPELIFDPQFKGGYPSVGLQIAF